MSLRKKANLDMLDISLRQCLRNWVARACPPQGGRERLLQSAAKVSSPRPTKITGLVYLALGDEGGELYLERFKIFPYYSLHPGSLDWTSAGGLA